MDSSQSPTMGRSEMRNRPDEPGVNPNAISGALLRISEELDHTESVINELGERLYPVRREPIEKRGVDPGDAVDGSASEVLRRLEGHVYRIMNQRNQMIDIIRTLEV